MYLCVLILLYPLISVNNIEASKLEVVDRHNEGVILIHSLKGNWNVTNDDHSINVICYVPGGIYSDLMKVGIINNIYKNYNDIETRWVAKENWKYFTNFIVSGEMLAKKAVFLIFNGIDTFSTIHLNGKEIGFTKNMFRRYRYNVKDLLEIGINTISVYIHSPIAMADKEFELETNRRLGIPVQPLCTPEKYNGECHVNHIRKQQASFSWDWGPAFPSSGIWKEPVLETYDVVMIRDIEVHMTRQPDLKRWDLKYIIHLEGLENQVISGQLISKLSHYANKTNVIVNETSIENYVMPRSGRIAITQRIFVPDAFVDLWWPNGYGEQPLYDLNVTVESKTEYVSKTIKIGFRTIKLIQKSLVNYEGLTFYFKVNDMPIFMKGSNWIPSNILPECTLTEDGEKTIRQLLMSTKIANMNMLRVWGGGVYESDFFYSLADELGILIWQDFMFACSMYPSSDSFLRNVEREVEQQVTRLQHHPSIAIWAGNNENEIALRNNWYSTGSNFSLFKEDYIRLYVGIIKTKVEKLDGNRPFIVSSPGNGKMSEAEGYIAENPGSGLFGDVHVYNYYSNAWLSSTYPNLRFSSEYGLQSMPNYETLKEATDNPTVDLQRNSVFMRHRQHFILNYIVMDLQIFLQFPTIKKIDFKEYIYKSQIVQAVAMKVETEKYRQLRNTLYNDSTGLTMGALYWQLNDVWQAPSWSSIDFAGRWKMLHYYAKNFFAPVLISGNLNGELLTVYISSDVQQLIEKALMTIILHKYTTFKDVYTVNKTITIIPQKSLIYYQHNLNNLLRKTDLSDTIIILRLKFNADDVSDSVENYVLTGNFKKVTNKPSTTCTVLKKDDLKFLLSIRTNSFTPFVWLQTNTLGYFSDNGFMMTNKEKLVYFYSDTNITTAELQDSIRVSSLRNTTQLI